MNRLQKKCVIGTAGIHLLLFLILIVGPAFFNREPKADNTVLDVIPANLVDNALNSGVQDAQPPPPTPPTPPTPQQLQPPPPIQPPPQPQPVQPPPQPAPRIVQPDPTLLERMEKYFKPEKQPPTVTPDLTPVNKPTKSHKDNNIDVNTQMVTRKATKDSPKHASQPNQSNAKAIDSTLRSLKSSLSSATKIDMPGNASAAYANYATVVRSVYEQMLLTQKPDQVAHDDETTKVKIVVGSDGTIISSSITSPSGDPAWDNAVQRTLDKVTFIAPFPEGATDKERPYYLSFNPNVLRSF